MGKQVSQKTKVSKNKIHLNWLALAGFITSFFVGLVGLPLCIVALNQFKKRTYYGKGLAIAGIPISCASLIVLIAIILVPFVS